MSCSAHMSKPNTTIAIVKYQKLRALDVAIFKECIRQNNNLHDTEAPLHDLITNHTYSIIDTSNSQASVKPNNNAPRPH